MSSLAAMVFWLSPTARTSATAHSILGPLAGRWTRWCFFGGRNGVGVGISGVSFIRYASCLFGLARCSHCSFFWNALVVALPRGHFCYRASDTIRQSDPGGPLGRVLPLGNGHR